MPADRLLNTVLQHYQDVHDATKTEQIIGTTTHLLTELSNPLNLSVLTSQLLTAPAIWQRPDGLRTSLRIVSIFNSAAVRVRDNEGKHAEHKEPREGAGLRCEAWTTAVVKGADDRSKRWQHLLVLTGVLMGLEGGDRRALSRTLRSKLEEAVVTAGNLALETETHDGTLAAASVVMALNFAFPLLSDYTKTQINSNALLPATIWALTADEGFYNAHFLDIMRPEISNTPGNMLAWGANTPSFRFLQEMERRPLMANVGPLSKLAGFAAQQATDSGAVLQAQDALLEFSRRVLHAWQQCPFSGIDPAAEGLRVSGETLQTTWPVLWQVLKKLMFGVVAVLQAIVSRSLLDPRMVSDRVASEMASKSLRILRDLFFISSRDGNSAFQVYTFTYLTSIDVLSRNPAASEMLLQEMRPVDTLSLPPNHLQRTLSLFYLNLAEHMPLNLSTEACEYLVIQPATAYLSNEGLMSPAMIELFESAHSAVLSALSWPQHSSLTIRMAPFYISKLFESFPHHISSRQFRVAFKTVMQIVSPPFPVAAMEQHLSEALLEMLRFRLATASTVPLNPTPDTLLQDGAGRQEEPLSEQSTLVLALTDSLPFLPLSLVDEWLTITGQILNEIADPRFREPVKKRFLDVLVSGEMDVERAAVGVAWWGTRGGRELVLLGGAVEPAMMSGAIDGDAGASRL